MPIQPLAGDDPAEVGPYRLLGVLGAGGMGRVYLARSAGGRTVAVKLVRPELADGEEFRVRFAREVAAARRVDGAHTAAVVDADPDAAQPWLATAYVPGPSLSQAVRRYGPLPEASVRTLGDALARALAAVHRAGLVHRDLKPSNVLLAADGPRVVDFGIARAVDGDRLTRTGVAIGTPGFMSPEQANGQVVGPASDVFSLGSVLVFATTGRGPFDSDSGPAVQLYKVVHERPDLADVPDGLRPLVEHCLAKEPERRPALVELQERLSAGAAVDWLPAPVATAIAVQSAAVLELETPRPGQRPGAVATAAAQSEGRPRRAVLLGGAAALAAVVAGGAAAWRLTDRSGGATGSATSGPNSPDDTDSRPPSRSPGPDAAPKPVWTYDAIGALNAPPLVADGTVLLGGDSVFALDSASGKERWRIRDASTYQLAAAHGTAFFTVAGDLVGHDLKSGAQRWRYTATATAPTQLLGADDHGVYTLADRGADLRGVAGFSPETGAVSWFSERRTAPEPGVSSLMAPDHVLYGDDKGNLVCRSTADGREVWSVSTGAPLGHPMCCDGERVYCAYRQRGLQALRLADGKQLWSVEPPADGQSAYTPPTVADGVVYATAADTDVHAFRAGSGEKLWSCGLPDGTVAPVQAQVVARTLVVPTGASGLYAIDTATGRIRWTFRTGSDSSHDWLLTTDGQRLIAQHGAEVYALPLT
ncbi:outer membrane protein assembly factor BamB family protein [Kitasatospora cathayae]|uniref:PQQ-binding-like beta-propeller repeat protein n=1 Tax=Kitasatospora cathayae TaxID=3004092 RepID=A0ABY7PW67_9ACTN|nr:PQQ-binding-like beta-propeller repeat protein [Kitasatospora sp. HUAS 3-15]WBP84685.1 PQQ-binding-like beta-propeller repeat protein [Kitasatospora sp. HUAS 3-15]